ncbi:MAG: SpoIIE family protein phosphatase [Pyrinomonadaceae bacterium]|nr:SpoIIE family protein phosphatase [Pyrinomonadaceae bacterium]
MKRLRRVVKARARKLGEAVRREASPALYLACAEVAAFCLALIFLLTGSRAATLDGLGSRADFWAAAALVVLFCLLHIFARRRLLHVVERRFFPERYDERQIISDLGYAARGVTTLDQLFSLVAEKIENALHVDNISIFVLDDKTGDYICTSCSTSSEESEHSSVADSNAQTLVLARNDFVVRRLRRLAIPLKIDGTDFEIWERALGESNGAELQARRREAETLQRINSRLLLSVMMKDRLVGIVSLGARRSGRDFSPDDKGMLMTVAGQMGFIIENAKLVGRMVEEERLRRELAVASEVQQRLFPASAPEVEGLELAGYCRPAREIGGDYYDFLQLENGQTGIAIADVAGKGISAALLMSIVQASLRSQATASQTGDNSLADLVSTMNRLIYRSTNEASYATFFYAQFDDAKRILTYTNAGHNAPLLLHRQQRDHEFELGNLQSLNANRASSPDMPQSFVTNKLGEVSLGSFAQGVERQPTKLISKLETGGTVLGVFSDCFYEQETIQLHEGDLLIAYTDGVTESLNAEGEEFGEARLREILISGALQSADDVRRRIEEEVRAWSKGTEQHDDLTFIVMKVKRRKLT